MDYVSQFQRLRLIIDVLISQNWTEARHSGEVFLLEYIFVALFLNLYDLLKAPVTTDQERLVINPLEPLYYIKRLLCRGVHQILWNQRCLLSSLLWISWQSVSNDEGLSFLVKVNVSSQIRRKQEQTVCYVAHEVWEFLKSFRELPDIIAFIVLSKLVK